MIINSIIPSWSEIGLFEQIFWIIAIPATLIFALLLLLTFIGSDVHADIGSDVDSNFTDGDSIPFQFLSLKNIVAFFAVFGWSGIGFIHSGLSAVLVILLSVTCGVLMMFLMASLFYFMSKLAENGTMKMQNAIGKQGEVYLFIPENRKGIGKVQVTVQGSVRTLDAMTDDPEKIPTAAIIKVVDVINDNILIVKKQNQL